MLREVSKPQENGNIEGSKNGDLLREPEFLWKDPNVVTVSVVRHGQWLRNPKWGARFGTLSPEGVGTAKEAAKDWAAHLPENAEVSMYESPSFVPAEQRASSGETKTLTPMRASITASVFEKAVFGNLMPGEKDEFGMAQGGRRKRDARLGDFMGSKRGGNPEDFTAMRTIGEVYGGVNEAFWRDYYTLEGVDPRVEESIKKSGGTDYLGLAENMTDFIVTSAADLRDRLSSSNEKHKEVALAFSHGETIRAFSHFLSEYLKSQGNEEAAALIQSQGGAEPQYAKGFDAHLNLSAGNLIVNYEGVGKVEVSLRGYSDYLATLREAKNSKIG